MSYSYKKKKRKILFLLSGGVDSTVCFALLSKVIAKENLIGLYIDTGFMRKDETQKIQEAFEKLDYNTKVIDASQEFFSGLKGIYEPEKKREIIGDLFVKTQENALEKLGLLQQIEKSKDYYLGQGTIYPDTVESGSSEHSHKIKTHHNRVESIQKLIEQGRVIEPLKDLYKNEVRSIGHLLKLPSHLIERHPFPGPALAVRCLCVSKQNSYNTQEETLQELFYTQINHHSRKKRKAKKSLENEKYFKSIQKLRLKASIMPLKTVGVQGDKRSYKRSLALFFESSTRLPKIVNRYSIPSLSKLFALASATNNRFNQVNRVLLCLTALEKEVFQNFPKDLLQLHFPKDLNKERIKFLQEADKIVMDFF